MLRVTIGIQKDGKAIILAGPEIPPGKQFEEFHKIKTSQLPQNCKEVLMFEAPRRLRAFIPIVQPQAASQTTTKTQPEAQAAAHTKGQPDDHRKTRFSTRTP